MGSSGPDPAPWTPKDDAYNKRYGDWLDKKRKSTNSIRFQTNADTQSLFDSEEASNKLLSDEQNRAAQEAAAEASAVSQRQARATARMAAERAPRMKSTILTSPMGLGGGYGPRKTVIGL